MIHGSCDWRGQTVFNLHPVEDADELLRDLQAIKELVGETRWKQATVTNCTSPGGGCAPYFDIEVPMAN